MGKLVPTVITDRNGRVTTVHRRDETGASKAASFPVPQVAPALTPSVTDEIMDVIRAESVQPVAGGKDEVLERLSGELPSLYPAEVLVDVHRAMQSHPSSRKTLSLLIKKKIYKHTLHEAAVFLPEVWVGDAATALNSVAALHDYEGRFLPLSPNYAVADDDIKKQCVALVNVTAALEKVCEKIDGQPLLWRGQSAIPVITDHSLVKLIIGNPEKAPLITNFIQERFSADPDAISEVISASSPQLAEGSL